MAFNLIEGRKLIERLVPWPIYQRSIAPRLASIEQRIVTLYEDKLSTTAGRESFYVDLIQDRFSLNLYTPIRKMVNAAIERPTVDYTYNDYVRNPITVVEELKSVKVKLQKPFFYYIKDIFQSSINADIALILFYIAASPDYQLYFPELASLTVKIRTMTKTRRNFTVKGRCESLMPPAYPVFTKSEEIFDDPFYFDDTPARSLWGEITVDCVRTLVNALSRCADAADGMMVFGINSADISETKRMDIVDLTALHLAEDINGLILSIALLSYTVLDILESYWLTSTSRVSHSIPNNDVFPLPILIESSITLAKTAVNLSLDKVKTVQLVATILPNTADQSVIWKSSNPLVATVDNNGFVTALTTGFVSIVAQDVNGNEIGCSINVYEISSTVLMSSHIMDAVAPDLLKLSATVIPATYSQDVVWSSSDVLKATVDQLGNVTALSGGEVTITATNEFGNSDSCVVTVVAVI
jgi:hypothetical protein